MNLLPRLKPLSFAVAAVLLPLLVTPAHAVISIVSSGSTSGNQYSLDGSSYTQDFNTLGNANAGYANGGTRAWADDSTLAGWSVNGTSGFLANSNMVLSNGASNPKNAAINIYSLGLDANSDRALAAFGSGTSNVGYVGLAFKNTTGSSLSSFTIGYTAEQWRETATASSIRNSSISLEYKIDAVASDLYSTSGWSLLSGSTFTSNKYTTSTAPVAAGALVDSQVFSPITFSATIADQQTISFRWVEQIVAANGSGTDEIGIDDVSVSFSAATAVPEPKTLASSFGAIALLAAGLYRWKSRR